jgi:thiol peroxidase
MSKTNLVLLAVIIILLFFVIIKMFVLQKKGKEIIKRTGIVTVKGAEVTLLGKEIKSGEKAPDFRMIDNDMKPVSLADSNGKIRLFSVVYSLDTNVCDLQTERFEKEAEKTEPNIIIYAVSMDLPFAQRRYCGAKSISRLKTLSDHKDASFGLNYGVLILESRLLARSIFIVGDKNIVRYVEYVKEISTQPDYEKALAALKEVSKK